ncbi:MAG: metal ABC transporter permease [Acutalibacteraceae bacterium]
MIGTGLSNVSFGCVTVAVALNIAPLYISIPVVVASSFLLLRISDNSKIKGDSAIAMISSGCHINRA